MSNIKSYYRVELPIDKNIDSLREWCKQYLRNSIKLTYKRKYDKNKRKWVRDYNSNPMFRFKDESDALAFKLIWYNSNQ